MDAIAQIRADMQAAGITQPQLADALGKSFDSVNRLLSGKRKLMADEFERIRLIISQRLGALEARGAELTSGDRSTTAGTRLSDIQGLTGLDRIPGMVPLYGFSITSGGATLRLDSASRVAVVAAHPGQSNAERGFAVEVVDETMAPRFEPGEIVYAVRGLAPRRAQDVVVEFTDGSAMIRRFVGMDTGSITVEQQSPSKKTTYRLSEIRHLHAIVGSGRR